MEGIELQGQLNLTDNYLFFVVNAPRINGYNSLQMLKFEEDTL